LAKNCLDEWKALKLFKSFKSLGQKMTICIPLESGIHFSKSCTNEGKASEVETKKMQSKFENQKLIYTL